MSHVDTLPAAPTLVAGIEVDDVGVKAAADSDEEEDDEAPEEEVEEEEVEEVDAITPSALATPSVTEAPGSTRSREPVNKEEEEVVKEKIS